jgi:formylglycine-generating enzyme required for sulfatase activity
MPPAAPVSPTVAVSDIMTFALAGSGRSGSAQAGHVTVNATVIAAQRKSRLVAMTSPIPHVSLEWAFSAFKCVPVSDQFDADSFQECDVCPEMVVVPAGSFTMGSPPGEEGRNANEGPQRRRA